LAVAGNTFSDENQLQRSLLAVRGPLKKYFYSVFLSVLRAIFPGGPCLAGSRMSLFWILLELRMMVVVVATGAVSHTKLQSNRHHQQTITQLFTGWMPFLSLNQQCQSVEGNNSDVYILTRH